MAQKIKVDFSLCESNGVCVGIIGEVFSLDENDYLQLSTDEVTPENQERIEDSVRQCPRQAISIVEE